MKDNNTIHNKYAVVLGFILILLGVILAVATIAKDYSAFQAIVKFLPPSIETEKDITAIILVPMVIGGILLFYGFGILKLLKGS